MFGISGEHLVILGIILLFFGPRRLPELGNTMGKAMKNFKDALSGVEEAKFRHLEEEKKANHALQAAQEAQSAHTAATQLAADASSAPSTATPTGPSTGTKPDSGSSTPSV